MSNGHGVHRFLSKRDKHGRGSSKHTEKSKLSSSESAPSRPDLNKFDGLFVAHAPSQDKEEGAKIRLVHKQLQKNGVKLDDPYIQYALRSRYAGGDTEKAAELLLLILESFEGMIKEYNPDMKLLGAENRSGVTCWLDALLFALFSRLGSFEAILYNSFEDRSRTKLASLLRLWVNLLRSGKLITTDITQLLQNSIAECGWKDAAELCQHDASEAFTFLTDVLELPHLTLKMDLYHTGKEDANDDHKFITERLLEVAIPPPDESDESGTITLEDCLETFFNNKVEVKRYLERRSTLTSSKSYETDGKATAVHVEVAELGSQDGSSPSTPLSPKPLNQSSPPYLRSRTQSIVQQRFIPENVSSEMPDEKQSRDTQSRPRNGSIRKEVMMPAWQFFSLIPWYTNNAPTNNAQVATHFSSQRPTLGICLKRYTVNNKRQAVRLGTKVDIPIEVGLPHFIHDDSLEDDGAIYGNFKLSLQSVVCHRGNSVDSGHYIALTRGTTFSTESTNTSQPDIIMRHPPEESRHWMRFDDLAQERITLVDIEKAMETETPYLLFYQIVPIEGDPSHTANGERPASKSDNGKIEPSQTEESLASDRQSAAQLSRETSRGRSPRPESRRQSIAFSETDIARDPHTTKEAAQAKPSSKPPSRRSSIITKMGGHSRSTSQNGEKRSSTFMKMSGMISREKLPQEAPPDVPEVVISTEEVGSTISGSGKATLRKEQKREKSSSRARTLPNTLTKHKSSKPDRECIVM